MECLPADDSLTIWLVQYGSLALFVLLTLGIIALPIPEETLMVLAGLLMSKGILTIPATIVAALAGSLCGITLSYIIGRTAGHYLFHKYGGWLGITEQRLQKAHNWFEHFGKWSLLVGYFIPGVRHFTGLSAGTTELDVRQFALFAYSGAVIWVSTFLSIGYFFGDFCLSLYESIEIEFDKVTIAVILVAIAAVLFLIRRWWTLKK